MSREPGPILHKERKDWDRIKFWLNRANDAWAMGEADWLNNEIGSNLLSSYVEAGLRAGDTIKDIAFFIENVATGRGIDPRRHKWHGKG